MIFTTTSSQGLNQPPAAIPTKILVIPPKPEHQPSLLDTLNSLISPGKKQSDIKDIQSRLAANLDEEEEPREELEPSSAAQSNYAVNHDGPHTKPESMNSDVAVANHSAISK